MPDSAIEGQEIIFLWDSPKDEKGNYIPYEQYVIFVKHGSAFDTSDFAIHKMQAREERESQENTQKNLVAMRDQLTNDPTSPVGGNPNGDVTIV